MSWSQYGQIKLLIDQYFNLKEQEFYDEFIKKLCDIFEI